MAHNRNPRERHLRCAPLVTTRYAYTAYDSKSDQVPDNSRYENIYCFIDSRPNIFLVRDAFDKETLRLQFGLPEIMEQQ